MVPSGPRRSSRSKRRVLESTLQLGHRLKDIGGASVPEFLLAEAAGDHGEGWDACLLGRLDIPGCVADHDRRLVAAGSYSLQGRVDEVGRGLGLFNVGRRGPAVDDLTGVE